jgi:hypothetical protein
LLLVFDFFLFIPVSFTDSHYFLPLRNSNSSINYLAFVFLPPVFLVVFDLVVLALAVLAGVFLVVFDLMVLALAVLAGAFLVVFDLVVLAVLVTAFFLVPTAFGDLDFFVRLGSLVGTFPPFLNLCLS